MGTVRDSRATETKRLHGAVMTPHRKDDVGTRQAASAAAAATPVRVTLHLTSKSGSRYLYDDVTGNLFPWDDAREAVLSASLRGTLEGDAPALSASLGAAALDRVRSFVAHWRDCYGAFAREPRPVDTLPRPDPAQIREYIRDHSMQLLLIVTQSCNLRCRYCVYSGAYPLNRMHTTSFMTSDLARRAIDWYLDLVQPQSSRNPGKKFGLTFFGGEPLLNAPVIRDALTYARQKHHGIFSPVMTTNGTLLTRENARLLVDHDVQVAVSIDGPAAEHDRSRLDVHGRGSHGRIIENLQAIRAEHPEFWARNLTTVCVYDFRTDIEAVAEFFDRFADVVPRPVFVNAVGSHNTSYHDQFTSEDRRRAWERLERLRERFTDAKMRNRNAGHYVSCLIGSRIVRTLLRQRLLDRRIAFLPFTGTCVPGDKIAVDVDGTLRVCERVNGTWSIGHLDRGGIDYAGVCDKIAEYQQAVMAVCGRCPVSKLCNTCFAFVETKGGFEKPPRHCAGIVDAARASLANYVSIREVNPRADFSFETDVSALEKQHLC